MSLHRYLKSLSKLFVDGQQHCHTFDLQLALNCWHRVDIYRYIAVLLPHGSYLLPNLMDANNSLW